MRADELLYSIFFRELKNTKILIGDNRSQSMICSSNIHSCFVFLPGDDYDDDEKCEKNVMRCVSYYGQRTSFLCVSPRFKVDDILCVSPRFKVDDMIGSIHKSSGSKYSPSQKSFHRSLANILPTIFKVPESLSIVLD